MPQKSQNLSMELSKLQIVALCVLTTILTDKFIVNHQVSTNIESKNQTKEIIVSPTLTPVSSPSAAITSSISTQNEIILKELINLRKDMSTTLNNLSKESTDSATTSTLSTSLLNGMVKISSSQWKRVNVYEKTSTSSKIVNSLVFDTIYFYRQKQNGWYQIDLDLGQLGWVQAEFLKEFP